MKRLVIFGAHRWKCRFGSMIYAIVVTAVCILLSYEPTQSQWLSQSGYGTPTDVRGEAPLLDLAPSNPFSAPSLSPGALREAQSIRLTPELFNGGKQLIPNLLLGYDWYFGRSVKSGRFTADYVLPTIAGSDSAFFGEAHASFQDFWKIVSRGSRSRIDLSVGGGYRKLLTDQTLLGVNAFYDTTRLGNYWYGSGGVGLEAAALMPGDDLVDFTFNWYGNLFKSNVLANAFRRGPANFDFQAGFSHELWNGGPDLRLNATGYKFSAGSAVYGGRAGAEINSRDGVFSIKYEIARDRINQTYHMVGANVNVGLRLERLLKGENPFLLPEPIFASPRSIRRLLAAPVHKRRRPAVPKSIVFARAGLVSDSVNNSPGPTPPGPTPPGPTPPGPPPSPTIYNWVLVHTDTPSFACGVSGYSGLGFLPGLSQADFSGPPAEILIELVFNAVTSNGAEFPPAELFINLSCNSPASQRVGEAILPLPDSGTVGTIRGVVTDPASFYANLGTLGNMRLIRWSVASGLTFSTGWWLTRINIYEAQ